MLITPCDWTLYKNFKAMWSLSVCVCVCVFSAEDWISDFSIDLQEIWIHNKFYSLYEKSVHFKTQLLPHKLQT